MAKMFILMTSFLLLCLSWTTVANTQATWTSVPLTYIGGTDLTHLATFSYTIPDVIPSTAKEVLIYARIGSGYANRGPSQNVKIFTQEGSSSYEKYLFVQSYNQEAINTNSDNMWFPMPSSGRIMMTVTVDQGTNCWAGLYAIGYIADD